MAPAGKALRFFLEANDWFCDAGLPSDITIVIDKVKFHLHKVTYIGVFIYLKCCSVHRSLGPNVSKVLLATIDEWAEEEINAMVEVGGNSSANSIYEAHVPKGVKPGPDASLDFEHRTKFIRLGTTSYVWQYLTMDESILLFWGPLVC
ncbi:ADP-ribosylation factor GTPase-activating protein AGD12-like isoform X2 [Helianthus annuus]|uniref:ADP-ribosylation factor GTPase-activating protein AGD12-like isoform X2 n=1 Tax=Helianthus annuus TaxID=4232 RepID=UPI000B903542|nr:ADP-ribosylation factor GTPase-activating protein AGD12-like isoform X2 [Helianthus annuus]